MRKGLLILNIVLIVLVAILYYLHFKNPVEKNNAVTGDSDAYHKMPELKLAYVEMDTLEKRYEFFKDVEKRFERKKDSIDNYLNSVFRAIEQKRKNFFQRGNAITQAETESFQQEYQNSMMSLESQKQELSKRLYDERGEMIMKVIKRIEAFLQVYNQKHNFYFIFGVETTSLLFLHKEKSLDITQEIVDGLNTQYRIEKK